MTHYLTEPSHIGWRNRIQRSATALRESCERAERQIAALSKNKELTDAARHVRERGMRASVGKLALALMNASHGPHHGGLAAERNHLRPRPPGDAPDTLVALRELDQLKQLPDSQLVQALRYDDRARYLISAMTGKVERDQIQQRCADLVDLDGVVSDVARQANPSEFAAIDETAAIVAEAGALAANIAAKSITNQPLDPSVQTHDATGQRYERAACDRFNDPGWLGDCDQHFKADMAQLSAMVDAVPATTAV